MSSSLVMIPVTVISGVLIFAMFGATNSAGMIVFAILYGFFSGGGAVFVSLATIPNSFTLVWYLVISILAPVTAGFSRDVGEVGYVILLNSCQKLHIRYFTLEPGSV